MAVRAAVFYASELGDCPGLPSPRHDGAEVAELLRSGGIAAESVNIEARSADAVWVIPCELPSLLQEAAAAGIPHVLTSLFRPRSPWFLGLEEAELAPLREPWGADLARRQQRARALRADAYADSVGALVRAIEWLGDAQHPSSGLVYRGALFNEAARPALGEVFSLVADRMILGRGRNTPIPVLSPQVARHHLALQSTADETSVVDLGGTNETHLQHTDGHCQRLTPGEQVRLAAGDEIIVADGFRFRWM